LAEIILHFAIIYLKINAGEQDLLIFSEVLPKPQPRTLTLDEASDIPRETSWLPQPPQSEQVGCWETRG
jgi:hypothetical protein